MQVSTNREEQNIRNVYYPFVISDPAQVIFSATYV